MSKWIDSILALLKWPIAIAGLLSLPALGWALLDLLRSMGSAKPLLPLLLGAIGFVVAWVGVLRRPALARWATIEHELTHALFAWATFHRTVGFLGTWKSGGHVRHLGKGNWLIAIAPFVVPTFSLAAALVLSALPRHALVVASPVLGVTLAYHAVATWSRTHRHQGDLREVGTLFAIFFVPAATLLVYGVLLALVAGGGRAMHHYVHQAFGHALGVAHLVWSWIKGAVSS